MSYGNHPVNTPHTYIAVIQVDSVVNSIRYRVWLVMHDVNNYLSIIRIPRYRAVIMCVSCQMRIW